MHKKSIILISLLILTGLFYGSDAQAEVIKRSFGKKLQLKKFYSVTVDDNNVKWFLTESGIVSFDGKKWILQNKNTQLPKSDVKDIEFVKTSSGRKIWVASPEGAALVSIPVDKKKPVNTYNTENSPLLSSNVTVSYTHLTLPTIYSV